MHIFPVQVDDALNSADQETLDGVVVLGNDDKTLFLIRHGTATCGNAQVQNRNGSATDVGNTANNTTAVRQYTQVRARKHFLDLEHIDAIQLRSVQTEHQQFQPVLANQLSALITAVQNACHALTSSRLGWLALFYTALCRPLVGIHKV